MEGHACGGKSPTLSEVAMYFRLEVLVEMLVTVPTTLPLTLDLGKIKATLRAPKKEEIEQQNPGVSVLAWTAVLETEPPPTIRKMFEYLGRDTLPPSSPLSEERPPYIDKQGYFSSIP